MGKQEQSGSPHKDGKDGGNAAKTGDKKDEEIKTGGAPLTE
jgi:hypothetical protein